VLSKDWLDALPISGKINQWIIKGRKEWLQICVSLCKSLHVQLFSWENMCIPDVQFFKGIDMLTDIW